jgi:hypothetical protein
MPSELPSDDPLKIPSSKPSMMPSLSPSQMPSTTYTPLMESILVSGVSLHDAWTTVSLSGTYVSPIAVCTVKYDTGRLLKPAVVRMQNVGPTSFEIRLQNPIGDSSPEEFRDVHCVVVEQGSWEMPDGRKIEANKYTSTVTNKKNSWTGEQQTYANAYNVPIVLGQVMSYNDPKWSVFWSHGPNRGTPPNSSTLFTGKHVGEDTTIARADETVGYIVIEEGHYTSNTSDDMEIEMRRGPGIVKHYYEGSYTYAFDEPFSTTPAVAVLSQVAMDGVDGSWALLADISSTSIKVAVDEDTVSDDDRYHIEEELNYVVFSDVGVVQLLPSS